MRIFLMILIAFSTTGCLLEVMTTTAIQGELAAESAQSAGRAMERAEDSKSKIEIESAVRQYSGEKGYYPSLLNDLVPDYLTVLPVQSDGQSFQYNPQNGAVSIRKAGIPGRGSTDPMVMTQADVQNLQRLRGAVYRYWEVTGLYPPNLESLAPLYIPEVPLMSSGGAFRYDVTTGAVSHPAEFRQAPAQAGRPVGAGAGSNPNAIADGNTRRQNQIMDDLGF